MSGSNAGSGCFGDPCSDAIQYSITSNITGRVYLEVFGIHYSVNDFKYLDTDMRIWVKN